MNQMNLEIVNDKTKSHIGEINQNDSNLDLVFASQDLISVINCHQGEDLWGSDHYPINIDIQQEYVQYFKKSNRIATKETNWEKYTTIMGEKRKELTDKEYKKMNYKNKYKFICESIFDSTKKASHDENEEKEKENTKDSIV